MAAVDVQNSRFEVGVFGIAPGKPYDIVLIDRYDIRKSLREDADGDHEWVKPGSYLEDWDLLIGNVLQKTYPLSDGSGRQMAIKLTVCDSGGKEGVTTNAYNFYRRLRTLGLAPRFHLVKGDSSPNAPRVKINYPDSNRKDRFAGARGDVPVLMINPNMLKDSLNGFLDCAIPGEGMYRIPDWVPNHIYKELCAEQRDKKTSKWLNPRGSRNETWDLSYYTLAACASPLLAVEKVDWEKPPSWLDEWHKNPMILAADAEEPFAPKTKPAYSFAELAKAIG